MMEVVYLFYESGVIRIPLFNYDLELFNLLAVRGGGFWDKTQREFIFRHDGDTERFTWDFLGIPWVRVEKTSPVPLQINGFWKRPWKEEVLRPAQQSVEGRTGFLAAPVLPVQSSVQPAADFTTLGPLPLPEKLGEQWRTKLEAEMRSRKLSSHTRNIYLYYNSLLCRIVQKPPEKISAEDVTNFLARMDKTGNYSASTMNLALSAFKFFYRHVIKNNITRDHYRPRQDKKLPVVFSKNEIKTMFAFEKNIKHRLLLMLVYASGLRVSEAVNLKHGDLDTDRMTVSVKGGKGRKDRDTRMAEEVFISLTEYYKLYHISPDQTQWVFPSYDPSKHITIRTAQYIFEKALKRCNIAKKASTHCLRHTYATHLLESGTDITYIKELMGHNSIKTTERYTHVAKRKILQIKSPLDLIDEPEK